MAAVRLNTQLRVFGRVHRALDRRERSLESRGLVLIGREIVIEPIRKRRSVNERREMRGDQRRKPRCVAEVRRDVGEVLDDVRMVALA